MIDSKKLALHLLSSLPQVGPKRLTRFVSLGVEEVVSRGKFDDFVMAMGSEKVAYEAYQVYINLDREAWMNEQSRYLENLGVRLLVAEDDDFPELLARIAVPPVLLYVKGHLRDFSRGLAVVGTRKFSGYGERVCETLVSEVARCGVPIVSGLALGIDSVAHRAALDVGGRTIAVLGGGLDPRVLYPKRNRELAERIVDSGGALVSEFPPDMQPRKEFFVMRNRLVAGMCEGVLVIEAPMKSGTMITAEFATDEGREVMAVPGDVDRKNSQGTNSLIRQGATMVMEPRDILEALRVEPVVSKKMVDDLPDEYAQVMAVLTEQSAGIEELCAVLAVEAVEMMTTLSMMELAGLVVSDGQGVYQVRVQVV